MKVVITDLPLEETGAGPDCHLIVAADGAFCRGCFGCWTRTPGECVIQDDLKETGAWLGAANELILIARCCFGSISPAVKRVLDRAISYIHPYFEIRGGEMHHRSRYGNHLRVRAHLYSARSAAEEATARGILMGNAANYAGTLEEVRFYPNADSLIRGISL